MVADCRGIFMGFFREVLLRLRPSVSSVRVVVRRVPLAGVMKRMHERGPLAARPERPGTMQVQAGTRRKTRPFSHDPRRLSKLISPR